MIIQIVTSKTKLVHTIQDVRKIIDTIHSEGHSLAKDWIEPAYTTFLKASESDYNSNDWSKLGQENTAAIAKADILIAESTYPSFGVGYQTAMAVQQKKPVLVLRNRKSPTDTFAKSIDDGCIAYKEYEGDDISEIVANFLQENTLQQKDMRFNFFIDRSIYNYLRWASVKTGKNKSEILRDLVQREIDKPGYGR